jgi:hypothetical protein
MQGELLAPPSTLSCSSARRTHAGPSLLSEAICDWRTRKMKRRFIRLTKIVSSQTTKPILVQASLVTYVDENRDRARLHFGPDASVRVTESSEDVLRLLRG